MSIASLYPSINPSLLLDFANSKVLDPRITFTRTTTATYYDGVTTAKAEENLAPRSQELDNTSVWTVQAVTVTANTSVAPDGTTTADTITASATSASHFLYFGAYPSVAIGIQLGCSVFAKAGTNNFFQLSVLNDTNTFANFDLSTGTIGSTGSNVSSVTMTSVGSGWYRCSFVITSTTNAANSALTFAPVASNTVGRLPSWTPAGTETVLLWGAQLEQRSSVTAYTATTTQAITNYIPVLQTAAAGQARFDHNPTTGESLGLLIEEARTNACPYSEAIGSWSAVNATAQSNVTIAPSGALTADKILPNATASVAHGWYNTITAAASTTYTTSIFAKAAEYSWLYLTEGNNVTATAYFNLSTGALGTVTGTGSPSATITSVGNGWYRCSLTFTTAVGATEANIQARVTTADNTTSFTASSSTVGYSGIFVWGGQFETGSFATSYIPNLSTGSTTRNADAASMTGTNFSSWFNNGEGTIYAENSFIGVGSSSYPGICKFSDGTVSNRFGMYGRPSGAGYGAVMTALGSTTASLEPISGSTTTAINTYSRLSYGYKVNDFGATRNASTVTTDTSGNVAVGVNQLNIGLYDEYMNGTIKKLAYYPIKATSAQLQALTV